MASKMGKRLIGIAGVAVTAIYTAGYIYTMPSVNAQTSSGMPLSPTNNNTTPGAAATAHSAHTASKSSSTTNSTTSPKKKPSTSSSSTAASSSAAKYKNGTYTGMGTNPYGSIALTVTIAHGKISAVHITNWSMHYPQSVVDPQLPQEVVQMQTYQIYIVSGATASTYNFAQAVYQALQKAKA